MAERRMMSKKVIDTDAFMELPMSAQCLYMHFMLQADDDGFLCNAKRVTRSVGGSQADIDALIKGGYLIAFKTGVVLIAHWLVHNLVRKDRYHETTCPEAKLVTVDKNNIYVLVASKENDGADNGNQMATKWQPNGNHLATKDGDTEKVNNDGASEGVSGEQKSMATKWQPNGNHLATEVRLGKDRLGKDRLICSTANACARACEAYENNIHPVASEIELQKIEDDVGHYGEDVFIKAIERAVVRGHRSLGYIEGILKDWEVNGYDEQSAAGSDGAGAGKKPGGQSGGGRGETDWSKETDGWGDFKP